MSNMKFELQLNYSLNSMSNGHGFGSILGSTNKRQEFRRQIRGKQLDKLFKNRREQMLLKSPINVSSTNQIDTLLSQNFDPTQIYTLSKLLIKEDEYELRQQYIIKLLECYLQLKQKQDSQLACNLCCKIETPTKNWKSIDLNMSSNHSSAARSMTKHSDNLQINQSIYIEKFLFMLTNQSSKNSWAQISLLGNERIINTVFTIISENVREWQLLANNKYAKEDLNRIKNILLFSIIVLGNLCVNQEIVRRIICNDLIMIIIYEYWPILDPDYYEDVSFLIANMLYHYPFDDLLLLDAQTSESQKAQSPKTIVKNWEELTLLYQFLCEQLVSDLEDFSSDINASNTPTKSPKNQSTKMRNHKKTYNRYYRNDLMDSIIKIRHLILMFLLATDQSETQQSQTSHLCFQFMKQSEPSQCIIFKKIVHNLSKVSSHTERLRTLQKQNNYKYLTGQKQKRDTQFEETLWKEQDLLRFVRNMVRLNFKDQSKDIQYSFVEQLYCETNPIDLIHRVIISFDSQTVELSQINVNQHSWQIIDDVLNQCCLVLQSPSTQSVGYVRKYIEIMNQELSWLQECVQNQGRWLSENQSNRATLLYFKYCHVQYKIQRDNPGFVESKLCNGNKDGFRMKVDRVTRLLLIIKEKLKIYQQDNNSMLILTILESLQRILNLFRNPSGQKKNERRSSIMNIILDESLKDCYRPPYSSQNFISQKIKKQNKIKLSNFLQGLFERYQYCEDDKEDDNISDIKSVLREILYGQEEVQ